MLVVSPYQPDDSTTKIIQNALINKSMKKKRIVNNKKLKNLAELISQVVLGLVVRFDHLVI